MKKFILLTSSVIFSFGIITESRAECYASVHQWWSGGCYNTWKPGVADNCGDGCTYTYNNGKLTVTATKPDAVIPEGFFSSSYYESGVYPNVTGIEIDGEFKTIGTHAFLNNAATISGKGGVLYTNNINHNAFGNNNTLTGTIIVSDKQTVLIAGAPWYYANLNATVILPPTIKSISGMALEGLRLGENAKIYCGAENCEELFSNVDCDAISERYVTQCKNNLKTLLASGKLLAYPDGCTKMDASGCTKCKNENFKLNDGECDRLRWTPAEAAKVLTDDNNNSVTITFKK